MNSSRRQALLSRRTVLAAGIGAAFIHTIPTAWARTACEERRLLIENPHTGESFSDVYWCRGQYVESALRQISWVMRDFHRDIAEPIDPSLLDLLHRLAAAVEAENPVRILSGYRSPETNRLLRREGLSPASNSQHLYGKAADICIQGVRLRDLRRAALEQEAGGVGLYPRDGFLHVDVGPVRTWAWPPRRLRRRHDGGGGRAA
jgi:uncharacterized protein YcbK (DUF882 family)